MKEEEKEILIMKNKLKDLVENYHLLIDENNVYYFQLKEIKLTEKQIKWRAKHKLKQSQHPFQNTETISFIYGASGL